MPVYQYHCKDCGVRFERTQSFNDAPLAVCPECEGEVYRVIGPTGVIFKGSGFYVTDNRRSNSGGSSSKSSAKSDESSSPKSEPKSEASSTTSSSSASE